MTMARGRVREEGVSLPVPKLLPLKQTRFCAIYVNVRNSHDLFIAARNLLACVFGVLGKPLTP